MYRHNKKMMRRSRRLHNEAKDKPRPWWQEDREWAPSHVETARRRVQYKRAERKWTHRGWINDFGVTIGARKRKHPAWHERKPYERPVKT
jgi:hypothetical protein